MEHTRLGTSGLTVSRLCLGMMSYGSPDRRDWLLGEDAAEPIVRQAVESGVTFFDTADMYSGGVSELITSRLLAKLFPRRDDYVLRDQCGRPSRIEESSTVPGEDQYETAQPVVDGAGCGDDVFAGCGW